MQVIFKSLFEETWLVIRFNPTDDILSLLLWSTVNTGIRAGCIYGLIRIVATAVKHGAFF